MLTLYTLGVVIALASIGTWFAWDPAERLNFLRTIPIALIGYLCVAILFSLDPREDAVGVYLESTTGVHSFLSLLLFFAVVFLAPLAVTRVAGYFLMWLTVLLVLASGDEDEGDIPEH